MALPLRAADISFDPTITQDEFATFSRTLGQAIFATPVQPARVTGLLGFDVGVAATFISVDTNAAWWQHSVSPDSNFVRGNYAAVPRLVASKGLGFATISGGYAKVRNSDVKTYGGAVDVPVIRGTLVTPELALRGSYATLSGVDQLDLKTYGVELFVSKGFGPLMPYGAIGRQRTSSSASFTAGGTTHSLSDTSNQNRYTAGVRFSLLLPKIVVEATQAERRSYAAKISFGF